MHTRLSITVNAVLFLDDWGVWGVEDGFPSSNTGRFELATPTLTLSCGHQIQAHSLSTL